MDEKQHRYGAGLGAVGLALLLWSWPAILAKGLPIDPLPLVLYRGWLGSVWAIGILLVRGRRLTWRGMRVSFWGGVALGFDLIFFFSAVKLTTIANTMVIGALQPAILVFVAPLVFKERLRLPDVGAAAVAVGGVSLVVLGSSGLPTWSLRGDFFAVLTLLAWTGYLVASKVARRSIGSTEFAACVTLIATLVATPLVLVSDQHLALPEPIHWLGLSVMAISGWGGHVLLNWSLAHIPIWIGGTAALAIPVIASVLAFVFLDEALLPIQLGGMGITIVALTVVGARTPKVGAAEPPA